MSSCSCTTFKYKLCPKGHKTHRSDNPRRHPGYGRVCQDVDIPENILSGECRECQRPSPDNQSLSHTTGRTQAPATGHRASRPPPREPSSSTGPMSFGMLLNPDPEPEARASKSSARPAQADTTSKATSKATKSSEPPKAPKRVYVESSSSPSASSKPASPKPTSHTTKKGHHETPSTSRGRILTQWTDKLGRTYNRSPDAIRRIETQRAAKEAEEIEKEERIMERERKKIEEERRAQEEEDRYEAFKRQKAAETAALYTNLNAGRLSQAAANELFRPRTPSPPPQTQRTPGQAAAIYARTNRDPRVQADRETHRRRTHNEQAQRRREK